MKLQNRLKTPSAHCLFALGSIFFIAHNTAQGAPNFTAFNDATIQPGGPRTGTNGKIFFNAEGSSNNSFASFGVADFRIPSGVTLNGGGTLSLTLTQSNASFTHNGSLAFYLSSDTTDSIDPGASHLTYQVSGAPSGLGMQLSTLYLLGTGTFTEVANGQADMFSFTPAGATLSYLTNQVDTAGVVRLIVAPNDASVSATYAGFSNSNASTPGPLLSLSAATVPEPAALAFGSVGLGVIGLLATIGHARRGAVRDC